MTDSKQVIEWQAQALVRGREEGLEVGSLIGQIRAYQELLNQPIPSTEDLRRQPREELTRIAEQLKLQIAPQTNGHT